MDLLLTMLTFALANVAFFYPLPVSTSRALQVVLVVMLGALVLVRIFQFRRPKTGPVAPAEPVQKTAEPEPVATAAPDALVETGVVQFLARLQEKGRLVDFLMDDITPYSNEQIGVVARVVHQGCREVVRGAFDIEPVHAGQEREAPQRTGASEGGELTALLCSAGQTPPPLLTSPLKGRDVNCGRVAAIKKINRLPLFL